MNHMFDTAIAEELSVNAAILFQHIAFWCIHSEANGTNYHDGFYWTYSSNKAFRKIFPYLSSSQIDTALKKLVEAGLVIRGNYNKSAYDRTIWYAVTKNGKSIYQKSKMEKKEIPNGFSENREPIPDIVPDIETNNSKDKGISAKRFTPPTQEEVEEYTKEKGYTISAERFIAYYESNGWKVGRNPMKDWRAAVRNWASRDKEGPKTQLDRRPQENPALNYEQREYKAEDYGEDFFVDLDKYGGD